ncbi:MAG: alpha/beta hydrolase [Proteobacteria bacterium]|nr:alpha/beta hydrolase [Pseudomonadota bacterium]
MPTTQKAVSDLAAEVADVASEIAVPSLVQMFSEVRSVAEAFKYLMRTEKALLKLVRPGDHRPILVLPGFLCNDTATWALRRFLRKVGYCSYSWRQGINWGPSDELRQALIQRLEALFQRNKQKITVVGWSLGGVYARELASLRPDLVEEVQTQPPNFIQGGSRQPHRSRRQCGGHESTRRPSAAAAPT